MEIFFKLLFTIIGLIIIFYPWNFKSQYIVTKRGKIILGIVITLIVFLFWNIVYKLFLDKFPDMWLSLIWIATGAQTAHLKITKSSL